MQQRVSLGLHWGEIEVLLRCGGWGNNSRRGRNGEQNGRAVEFIHSAAVFSSPEKMQAQPSRMSPKGRPP